MKYTVLWHSQAEDQLAALWMAAADKPSVTAAAHRIDHLLESNPSIQGESRGDDDRIMFEPPLAVLFRVDLTGRTVHVVSVGWSGKPA